jgi:hypothetical protein
VPVADAPWAAFSQRLYRRRGDDPADQAVDIVRKRDLSASSYVEAATMRPGGWAWFASSGARRMATSSVMRICRNTVIKSLARTTKFRTVEECERGNAAMEPAQKPVDVHGVELWQRARITARFHHEPGFKF